MLHTSFCKVLTFLIVYRPQHYSMDTRTHRHNAHDLTEGHHVCGVAETIRIIGAKWTVRILHALCDGTKRFGQLQRTLVGISPRTLSLRLQQLEREGIVQKKVFAQVPPKVEYSLTAKGKSLRHIIELMKSWGEHHAS